MGNFLQSSNTERFVRASLILPAVLAFVMLASCTTSPNNSLPCFPGEIQTCPCANGSGTGVQTCDDNGEQFGACECFEGEGDSNEDPISHDDPDPGPECSTDQDCSDPVEICLEQKCVRCDFDGCAFSGGIECRFDKSCGEGQYCFHERCVSYDVECLDNVDCPDFHECVGSTCEEISYQCEVTADCAGELNNGRICKAGLCASLTSCEDVCEAEGEVCGPLGFCTRPCANDGECWSGFSCEQSFCVVD